MASIVPTVRQTAWVSLIPQLVVMGLLILLYSLLQIGDPVIYGVLTYLVISFALRNFIPKDHRQGMKLVRQQNFKDAIPFFEKSVDFFTKNSWLDKYRFVVLLSSSNMTYKEMGLCNIAFCFAQTGDGQKAKEYYEQTRKEFPENGLAQAGLRMIDAFEKQDDIQKE